MSESVHQSNADEPPTSLVLVKLKLATPGSRRWSEACLAVLLAGQWRAVCTWGEENWNIQISFCKLTRSSCLVDHTHTGKETPAERSGGFLECRWTPATGTHGRLLIVILEVLSSSADTRAYTTSTGFATVQQHIFHVVKIQPAAFIKWLPVMLGVRVYSCVCCSTKIM